VCELILEGGKVASSRRRKGPAVNRTELLTAASSKLAEAVRLLTAAREERLAAYVEDLIQQVESTALESKTAPNTSSH
jgi:hypothetical protein